MGVPDSVESSSPRVLDCVPVEGKGSPTLPHPGVPFLPPRLPSRAGVGSCLSPLFGRETTLP